jgi:formylglycine-generating enzyme required for sulfatase activity
MADAKVRKETVKLIPAGRYWIGDDATQHAGPRHLATMDEPFWIDVSPVTVGDVQQCILAGGLEPRATQNNCAGGGSGRSRSVDGLFGHLLQTTARVFKVRRSASLRLSIFPACGLLLTEAQQICRFYGARLPTEIEWEISMGWHANGRGLRGTFATPGTPIWSTLGCASYAGTVEEWTRSAWTARYWTDNSQIEQGDSPEDIRVCVRGCLPTAKLASIHARVAAKADDDSMPRLFRRVWHCRDRPVRT